MNDNEKYIEEFVNDIPFDAPEQKHRDKLKNQLLNAFPKHRLQPTVQTVNVWRTIMKSSITKLAAAAAIIVAVIAGLHFIDGSDMTSVAFGDIVRPILTARTATLTLTRQGEDQQSLSYDVMYMEPLHSRSLMPGGLILIGDMNQGKVVALLSSKKKATIFIIPPEERSKGSFFEIRKLIREAQQHEQESVEFLGKQQIDGYSAIGYRIQHMTIWADSVTLLPIRIECIISSLTGRGHDTLVLTDFVFDVELDESLFNMEIPEGYTVVASFDADDFEDLER